MTILSTLTICLNEEEIIKDCIDYCLTIGDEIVIVDGGSTDNTVKIIKKLMKSSKRIKLYEHKMGNSFADQRNFAKSKCKGEWILQVDADEKYNDMLLEVLQELIVRDEIIGFTFPTYHLFRDEFHHTNEDADPHIRLFQNVPEVQYEGDVHEHLTLRGHRLVAHPSHYDKFSEQRIRYIADVRLLHYGLLRSKENMKKKLRAYKKFYKRSAEAGIPISDDWFKNPKPKKVFKIK